MKEWVWIALVLGMVLVVFCGGCQADAEAGKVPACIPCRWAEPFKNCAPSLCALRPSGQRCCVKRSPTEPAVK